MSDDCTKERADCNEIERIDKKNWSRLDQEEEACFAKSSRNKLEVGCMQPLNSIIKGRKETLLVLQALFIVLSTMRGSMLEGEVRVELRRLAG